MSKTTDDLIDRIQGAAMGLRGVKTKLSPQAAPAQVEVVTPAAPPPEVTQEDYDHAKKVIAELKANIEQLEAQVSRDSKAVEQGQGGVLGDPKSAAEHDTKAKAKT